MERYIVHEHKLGDGTFGTVYLGTHKQHGHQVAIKYMKREFLKWDACVDLREARILMNLSEHDNIVQLYDVIREQDERLYFVFEYMPDGNLYEFIRSCTPRKQLTRGMLSSPPPDLLTETKIQSIARQVLLGLSHLHSKGFLHRDVKPENILLDGDVVKLADFGLARELSGPAKYTEYISTRWYRAPEILLRSRQYGKPIDLFALGSIIAEMYSRMPLFPGENEYHQLELLTLVLGRPTSTTWPEGLELAAAMNFCFPQARASPQPVCSMLRQLVPSAPPCAIQLIKDLLEWNPNQRPTTEEALKHEFLNRPTLPSSLAPSVLSHVNPPSHTPTMKKKRVVNPYKSSGSKRSQPDPATHYPLAVVNPYLVATPGNKRSRPTPPTWAVNNPHMTATSQIESFASPRSIQEYSEAFLSDAEKLNEVAAALTYFQSQTPQSPF